MNRAQRRAHARLWPFLFLIMVAASSAALLTKAYLDRASIQDGPTQPLDD